MAYPAAVKETWQATLADLQEKGLFKQERYIHSPQSSHISVEFPADAPPREVINLCSNN